MQSCAAFVHYTFIFVLHWGSNWQTPEQLNGRQTSRIALQELGILINERETVKRDPEEI